MSWGVKVISERPPPTSWIWQGMMAPRLFTSACSVPWPAIDVSTEARQYVSLYFLLSPAKHCQQDNMLCCTFSCLQQNTASKTICFFVLLLSPAKHCQQDNMLRCTFSGLQQNTASNVPVTTGHEGNDLMLMVMMVMIWRQCPDDGPVRVKHSNTHYYY